MSIFSVYSSSDFCATIKYVSFVASDDEYSSLKASFASELAGSACSVPVELSISHYEKVWTYLEWPVNLTFLLHYIHRADVKNLVAQICALSFHYRSEIIISAWYVDGNLPGIQVKHAIADEVA